MTERIYREHQRKCRNSRGYSLLCGYYGYSNMGDDALLRASIERARKEYGDSIRALTKGGKTDSNTFGVVCAKRSCPLSILYHIAHCRRIIFGGGTLLQTQTSKRSFIYYASLLLLAKAMGRDRIIWANGIGAIDGRLCRAVFKKALSGCRYIELRDKRSQRILNKLLPNERASISVDLAHQKKPSSCSQSRAEYLLRRVGIEPRSRFTTVIPKANSGKQDIKKLLRELQRLRREGNAILIIPMYERQDLRLCEHLCGLIGAKLMCGICFDDLCKLASLSNGVCSMRYHGLVAAHLVGVDFAGLGNDPKLTDYCRVNGGKIL
jgi:polysaccharide pyruvyl transferase CsaB